MATVTLTLTDNAETGEMEFEMDFGEKFDEQSPAHQAGQILVQSILANAKSFEQIEDTAPDCKVEPSRIIVPGVH